MVKKLFICPPDLGGQVTCRTLTIPSTQPWLGIFNAAILTLANVNNYEQLHDTDLTPDDCAAAVMLIYADYLETDACPTATAIQSPYWDDAGDNEVEAQSDVQTWYGQVSDWLAPIESLDFVGNLAVWALTGFVAYAAGVGAALFFRTAAKRFVLAFETGDVVEIVRIIIDSSSRQVTIPANAGIVEIVVFGDDALADHDLYVIKGAPV